MEESVFTKIINREVAAHIVYEDQHSIAILDLRPVIIGHTLVIPKKPFVNIFDIPQAELASVMETVRKIAPAVRDAVGAKGVHINSNHGPEAEQMVPHLHFHIIPRHAHAELPLWPHLEPQPQESDELLADLIRSRIAL